MTGRSFGPEDRLGATETAVVNELFAKRYFPGTSPIGQSFQIEASPGRPQPFYQIVGLAKDTKYTDLREDFTPIAYLSAAQETELGPFLDLVVSSDMAPASLTPALTRAIREVAPNSTVAYETVRTYVRDSLVTERLMASAVRILRRSGDGDRDTRPLRRDVLYGEPPQSGDRYPDGARS